MEEFRILSPTGILGYGFPVESFKNGMGKRPHAIAVDAGSTDPGPYYLGSGISFTDRRAVKRDLEIILTAAIGQRIPVIIGTAGGCGGNPHLEWNLEIIKEIAREKDLRFKMAIIQAETSSDYVSACMEQGRLSSLYPAPELTTEQLEATVRIVGQMGIEPFLKALEYGVQVILAGRSYDPAVFAALAVKKGYDRGLALHLGKILECACVAATPGSASDCMFGYLGSDYFKVETLTDKRKCTTLSVAAHTLYEKTDPYKLPGPGGVLDLTGTRFEQIDGSCVRVTGSVFLPSEKYTVKLEGVKKSGYRTVSIAGTRDPVMIGKLDHILKAVQEITHNNFKESGMIYNLGFKIYGKNGIMGNLEPVRDIQSHELGIVIDVIAEDQEIANTICSFARSTLMHYGYEGRVSTAGNLAFPFSPSEFKAGEVYEFSIYHLIEVEDPNELFPIEILDIGV
ncbi:3-methylaspartate ammonia-lyase [Gordoniibacillus kamchatkensis]|uniref:3-methylaspartate ammonia-lyase n=1 Tax=Gordoniibacillus kamchatkensis TaxID=1590651 RepID=A0ABR5ANE6_9BACL|nr:acyclic terpene utilization AtuA family protein [Paenibacillus sp. VKM B-2647]KIL42485.1 3-methylaspartate ammonia-lyase [Paenibacillus sp. VKM B-2647]